MCIGIPMQVIEMRETHALCEANGKKELIDMILVGDQIPGTWILNFLGGAREVITPDNAQRISQALSALDQIMNGEIGGMNGHQKIDSLFADIIEDGPRLPPHLQAQVPHTLSNEIADESNTDKTNTTHSRQEPS